MAASFPPDPDDPCPPGLGTEDLVRKWQLVSREGQTLSSEQLLRQALGEGRALLSIRLNLLSAEVREGAVNLDFDDSILATNGFGTCGGGRMALQLNAMVRYYFPEAVEVCAFVEGVPSSAEEDVLLFHDAVWCPISLTR